MFALINVAYTNRPLKMIAAYSNFLSMTKLSKTLIAINPIPKFLAQFDLRLSSMSQVLHTNLKAL